MMMSGETGEKGQCRRRFHHHLEMRITPLKFSTYRLCRLFYRLLPPLSAVPSSPFLPPFLPLLPAVSSSFGDADGALEVVGVPPVSPFLPPFVTFVGGVIIAFFTTLVGGVIIAFLTTFAGGAIIVWRCGWRVRSCRRTACVAFSTAFFATFADGVIIVWRCG